MEWKSFDFFGKAIDVLEHFIKEPYVFLLESSLNEATLGRYSFIGFDPFDVFYCDRYRLDALSRLKKKYAKFNLTSIPQNILFPAGLMGFLSYDFGLGFEEISSSALRIDSEVPAALFGFYDCVITIDHFASKLIVTSTGLPELGSSLRKKRARERLQYILDKLSRTQSSASSMASYLEFDRSELPSSIKSNFTRQEYCQAVGKALDYIRAGEIYQVNLSQRFTLDSACLPRCISSYQLYLILRELSPSCFGGYFNGGNFQIVSSSPERFLHMQDRKVSARPMKGTVSRGLHVGEDLQRRRELEESVKDRAELLMITDLERNDLGRVCEYGSVRVQDLRTLEQYQTLYQTTSTIDGELDKDKDCFDLLRACFPGGSITGCPKIRAMQIIEELEPSARSLYTGSMGYISFTQNLDFNILIRTLLIRCDEISFQVGGGIVADSLPEKEYEETLVKAKALFDCLQKAFGLSQKGLSL